MGAGGAIANELVKSYGFKRDPDSGDWSWDAANIKEAFSEDPFWTTLDYLALIPPLAWGKAALALKSGQGALKATAAGTATARQTARAGRATSTERALAAGEFAGKQADTTKGFRVRKYGLAGPTLYTAPAIGPRISNLALGGETAAALQRSRRFGPGVGVKAAGAGKLGRWMSNPITEHYDKEQLELIERFGASPAEQRGVVQQTLRENQLTSNIALIRQGSDVQKDVAKIGGSAAVQSYEKKRIGRFLEAGLDPADELVQGLSPEARRAYLSSFDFRNRIHHEAYSSDLISKSKYGKNLKRYYPRVYEEWVAANETMRMAGMGQAAEKGGSFARRQLPQHKAEHLFTRILDPAAGAEVMMDAAKVIGAQKFAKGLAGSVIARTPDEIGMIANDILGGNEALAKLHGVDPKRVEGFRALRHAQETGRGGIPQEIADEVIAKELGWVNVDELFQKTDALDTIPDELKGMWMDPTVASDVEKAYSWMSKENGQLGRMYNSVLGWFRVKNTAYNPGTGVRNIFGASVFHHLAVGGLPFQLPMDGMKALNSARKGVPDATYKELRDHGLIGESFDSEIREALEAGFNGAKHKFRGQATGMDWIDAIPGVGGGAVSGGIKRGAGWMERMYRGVDETFRADAYIKLKARGLEAGLSAEDAAEQAIVQVHKFIPTFSQHSGMTDTVRKGIPFASFATESLRTWKNGMMEKPHLAYFWADFADIASQGFAAAAGADEEELEAAKSQLPDYMNNKKLLALPTRDGDGKLRFVDMSYLIPMANMVDGTKDGEVFFDSIIDPSANPVFSMAAATLTGKDPFSKREVGPRMTESMVQSDSKTVRKLVGLGEHAAMLMAPPLAPSGYAFQNLYEMARGKKDRVTGEDLEQGPVATILANVAGMRTYAPSVKSQIQNVKRETYDRNQSITQAWRRWETATANGRDADAGQERLRIIAHKIADGKDGEDYFRRARKRHEPGKGKVTSGISTKDLDEMIARAEKLENLADEDERLLHVLKTTRGLRR